MVDLVYYFLTHCPKPSCEWRYDMGCGCSEDRPSKLPNKPVTLPCVCMCEFVPELFLFGENHRADPDRFDVDHFQRPNDVLVSVPFLVERPCALARLWLVGGLPNRQWKDCSGSWLVRWFVYLSVGRNLEVCRVGSVPKFTFANCSRPHSSVSFDAISLGNVNPNADTFFAFFFWVWIQVLF